jgi:hypothetical protein
MTEIGSFPSFPSLSQPTQDNTFHAFQFLMNTSFNCLSRISSQFLKPRFSRHTTYARQLTTRLNFTGGLLQKSYNMAPATASLSAKLESLSLTKPLPKYPNCYPELNPVDIYRAHITSILTEVTGVDSAVIYPALQWTQTLEKGDLVLPVPALRVKGKKPLELATEWVEKVCVVNLIVQEAPLLIDHSPPVS